jgi:protein-disulfide isomerase
MRIVGIALLLSLMACASAGAIPQPVRDEIARAPKGVVTVMVFTDFQCPFCRKTHAALAVVRAAHPGQMRVVLRHVPLRMHPDAPAAARGAICAEMLGGGDPVIDALYRTSDLSEENIAALVTNAGVSPDAYAKCLLDPETNARIRRDSALLHDLAGDGVPLLYVDGIRLDGSQTRATLDRAVAEALRAK